MQRIGPKAELVGLNQNDFYNWHKSLGLVALLIALIRIWNRRQGRLPGWAPSLSKGERRFIHLAERWLYAAMLMMPISGFVFVMAGGYGVLLFGHWPLPNPFGKIPVLGACCAVDAFSGRLGARRSNPRPYRPCAAAHAADAERAAEAHALAGSTLAPRLRQVHWH